MKLRPLAVDACFELAVRTHVSELADERVVVKLSLSV